MPHALRCLAALAALAAALACVTGCELLRPSDQTIDAAMRPPSGEGEVLRDQYGNYVMSGSPSTYDRSQAWLDVIGRAAEEPVGP